jgi:iron(III) transport system substrate-binding protein
MTKIPNRRRTRIPTIAAIALTVTALAACGSTTSGSTSPTSDRPTAIASGAPTPPDTLLADAKKEGKLTIYTSIASAGLTTGIAKAFNKAYPTISVRFVSAGSTEVTGRYTAEAQANAVQADVVLTGYSAFYPTSLKAGYFLPIESVIPGFSKVYPANGLIDSGQTGIVFDIPNGLAYNTDLVKGDNIPKTFADFAKPYWKNHLLGFDPKASPAFLQFWDMMLKTYGADVIKAIGQNIIPTSKAATLPPAAQSLAAGEGYAALLMPRTTTDPLIASGAPIKWVNPAVVTGPQYALGVSAKGPDTAAAKLFAYWAYSRDGQADLTAVNTSTGALTGDTKDFYKPNQNIDATEQAQILSLLGE